MNKNQTKSKLHLITGLLLAVLIVVSCTFYSKEDYLKDFASFVTEIEQNYKTYSDEDWSVKDQEYEEYTGESYNKFKAELTGDEKKQVGKLKAKYNTVKVKHKAEKIIDNVSDGINQLQGVVEGVIEAINN
jgi:uncharacterized protein YxeA